MPSMADSTARASASRVSACSSGRRSAHHDRAPSAHSSNAAAPMSNAGTYLFVGASSVPAGRSASAAKAKSA